MNVRESLIRWGNENRIIELHLGGCGPHQISGLFKDHGIKVSSRDIDGVIRAHGSLCSKALPKGAVRAALRAHDGYGESIGTAA